jgi:hypothetical protein
VDATRSVAVRFEITDVQLARYAAVRRLLAPYEIYPRTPISGLDTPAESPAFRLGAAWPNAPGRLPRIPLRAAMATGSGGRAGPHGVGAYLSSPWLHQAVCDLPARVDSRGDLLDGQNSLALTQLWDAWLLPVQGVAALGFSRSASASSARRIAQRRSAAPFPHARARQPSMPRPRLRAASV